MRIAQDELAGRREPRRRRRRLAIAALGGLAVGAVHAEVALGDARVGTGATGVVVSVIAKSGADGAHAIAVEPFIGEGRDGWRVRQQSGGNPPFSSIDADCLVNPLANDVVCRGTRGSAAITMGDGSDDVQLRQSQPGGPPNVQCVPLPVLQNGELVASNGTATVSLGAGADRFRFVLSSPCPGGSTTNGVISMRVVANGNGGGDDIEGTFFGDTLRGDAGDDVLSGLGGDDVLQGGADRDTVSGGDGRDTVGGGDGDDALNGGPGDDALLHEPGADVIDGGPGRDEISYAAAPGPVFVDLDESTAVDGPAQENDSVVSTVEDVVGGNSGNALFGSGAANRLVGGTANDSLEGEGGNDTLEGGGGIDTIRGGFGDDLIRPGTGADDVDGGPGTDTLSYFPDAVPMTVDLAAGTGSGGLRVVGVENVTGGRVADVLTGDGGDNDLDGTLGDDRIEGGAGANVISGGPGNDTLSAVSTIRDRFTAGPGNDVVIARFGGLSDVIDCGDGTDRAELDLFDSTPPVGCETVLRFAIDDAPPARALGRTLRVRRDRRAVVRVQCPTTAAVACRGRLTVRVARRHGPGRLLARATYSVPLGARRAITVRLPARRRPAAVVVGLREPGISALGPRRSEVTLRVR